MSENRITELDSLRGLAALTVLFNHCVLVYPAITDSFHARDPYTATPFIKGFMFSPVHSLWNGHSAVLLFFVLSGFVLSVAYYSNKQIAYSKYVIKRMCRLYIPYLVTLTISVLMLNYYPKHVVTQASSWFNGMWNDHVTWSRFVHFLFLQGDMYSLGTTLWTIVIEIEVSLLLPFCFMLIKKISFVQNILLILFTIASFYVLRRTPLYTFIPDLKNLYYLPFFLLGGVIYKYKNRVKELNISHALALVAILPVALLLYNWDWLLPWYIRYYSNNILYALTDYAIGIGACMLIIGCLLNVSALKQVMNNKIFKFLGDISYSLYLIHPVILLFMVHTFDAISYNYLIFAAIAGSICAAYIYYLFIEKPSMRLGRYLSTDRKQNGLN